MSSLRNNYGKITDSEISVLLRGFTDDGQLGGNDNAAVDGSTTPVKFWIQPAPTTMIIASHLTVQISSSGNPGLDDYGNIPGPLTNGIQLFLEVNGNEIPFGGSLKTNRVLGLLFNKFTEVTFAGSIEVRTYSFDVTDHSKSPIILNGNNEDKFGVIIQDNVAALANHAFAAAGNIRWINR